MIFEEGRRLGLEYQQERAEKRHQFGVASGDDVIDQSRLQGQPLHQKSNINFVIDCFKMFMLENNFVYRCIYPHALSALLCIH